VNRVSHRSVGGDLVVYLVEPAAATAAAEVSAPATHPSASADPILPTSSTRHTPRPVAAPVTGAVRPGRTMSSTFSRLIELPGPELSRVLETWWERAEAGGHASIAGRLLLSPPHVDDGEWTFSGELRRVAGRRPVPMTLDLWPHNLHFTRLTMVPRTRTTPSRCYFWSGNRALDRLSFELGCPRSARTGRRPRQK
jgi:hypothetical protein